MPDPFNPKPTIPPTDPWVQRIDALANFVKMLVPYVIALGASFGWWSTSANNSAHIKDTNDKIEVLSQKHDDTINNIKEVRKEMTGKNRS